MGQLTVKQLNSLGRRRGSLLDDQTDEMTCQMKTVWQSAHNAIDLVCDILKM